MRGIFGTLDHPLLKKISDVADQMALDTYVIGGFVRDLLLKRPSQDIDIVCIGDGMALAQAVARCLTPEPPVTLFKRFGTAMLKWDGWMVEFVGARKESYCLSSRSPMVSPGTLQDDQLRRDFTINTLSISLNKNSYGQLIDPFQGQEDLKNGIIQTPCDPLKTFTDDPLRIIRAIRFATQLNFAIETHTRSALTNAKDRLKIIAQERIIEELHKIVASPKPSHGFKLLFDCDILPIIFPEMAKLAGQEQIGIHQHKDNFLHTLTVLDNVADRSSKRWLRWAAIFHDIAKPYTKRYHPTYGFSFHGHEDLGAKMLPSVFKRLKLPTHKEVLGYIQKLVRLHLRPIALVKEVTDTAIRRLLFEAGDDIEDLFLLCRADITSKNQAKVQEYLANFDRVEAKIWQLEERDKIKNDQPPITGEIIMQTFNLKPSPQIGWIKNEVKEAILNGEIKHDYQEAFAYMLSIGAKYDLKFPTKA